MPVFSYKAKDRSGNTVTGAVEAADERGAAAMIREAGHFPTEIRPIRSASTQGKRTDQAGSFFVRHFIHPIWTGVNQRALALFFRQLVTLLSSGMTLSEALGSVRTRTDGPLGRIVEEARENVQRGGVLSHTLSRYPRVFSRLQLSLVRAGESGGLLESMMDRIASYLEYEIKVRQLIAKAMFYPILVFIFIVLIVSALPYLPHALEPNGPSIVLAGMWSQLRSWLLLIIITLIALKLLFQFDSVRMVWDFTKIQPPVIGAAARKIAMSRFSRALAVLYAAGVPVSEAVRAAADACANIHIGRGILFAAPALEAGKGLTESLARTGAVTPMVLDMLATGEKSGSMDTVLQKAADYMDDEVDATIHKLGIGLFVLAVLIVAAIVLVVAVRFYLEQAAGALGRGL